MKETKTFDCVEMKLRLQENLREQEQDFSAEEIRQRRQQWLMTSENDLARWWRSGAQQELPKPSALILCEDPTVYGHKGEISP